MLGTEPRGFSRRSIKVFVSLISPSISTSFTKRYHKKSDDVLDVISRLDGLKAFYVFPNDEFNFPGRNMRRLISPSKVLLICAENYHHKTLSALFS